MRNKCIRLAGLLAAITFLTASARAAAPTIAGVIPGSNSVVRALAEVEVLFDSEIGGVDPSDLLINGLAATNLFVVSPSQVVFQFLQPAPGAVTVAFAAGHGITNTTGEAFAGGTWSYTLDTSVPPTSFIISEVQAVNDGTIRDEDGEYSDWIEIHNRAEVAGSLNGWFLTDNAANLTQWRIPDVAIPAGGYLLVFASGKDRTNNLARLHTSFGLRREGDYVALVDPRTNVVSAFTYPTWPVIGTNSYGRDRNEPNLLGFFTQPTPGQPNQAGGPGNFAPDVVASREQGTFVAPFTLSLSLATPNPNAEIRFVLVTNAAGAALTNVPSATSTLYTNPIPISRTMQVRTRAFAPNALPGTPISYSYIQIASNAVNFTSDLPLVIVHNFGNATYPSTSDQTAMVAFFEVDEQTGRSSLTNRPQLITRAGVNRRGSSTEGIAKASLAVELWNEFNDDTDHEVLGMPAESDWVLYAPNQFDHSLLHNPIGYELARYTGRYASRTRMVETFMDMSGGPVNLPNFTSGGDYTGIHVLEEKIKRNRNRVDIERIEVENTNAPSVTGGWLLKVDRQDADERSFTGGGQSIVYQDPDGRDVQLPQWDRQEQYIIGYFNAFGAALNGVNWTNPVTGYAAYIDIDSWMDAHLNSVITMNVDGFRLSGYFFKDRNKKIEQGPVWDFDRSMGTSQKGGDWRAYNPRAWRGSNPLSGTDYGTDFFNSSFNQVWWGRLFRDPDFWQRWIDTYQRQRETIYDTNKFLRRIDEMAAEIREAQTRELTRWGALTSPRAGAHTSPVNIYGYAYTYTFPNPGTYQGEVDFQKRWFADHFHFMDTNFLGKPILSSAGGALTNTVQLAMATPPGIAGTTIYYTLDGTDPRLPGGGISPNALTYVGPISITNNAHVFARSLNPNHRNLTGAGHPPISSPWSGRSEATFYATLPNLRITEIMYHPADPPTGNTNDADNFEYIEVKNVGTAPLSLARFRLRGGVEFDFPTNLTLAAGARAVVVADVNAFVSRYGSGVTIVGAYTNDLDKSNLDNGGEGLRLEGPLREPIHDFEYSDNWYPTTDGHGFSLVIRNENAAVDTWGLATSWRPSGALNGTPGQDEGAAPGLANVVINEVLTHTDLPSVDTIELLNLGAAAANIGGWFLTDNFNAPKKFRIPDGTTIAANGYITFDESQFNAGPNPFLLNSLGDEIYVFSGDGTNLTGYAHGFDFGAAINGVTFGRYVNSVGSEQFPAQSSPTLALANSGPQVGPVVVSEIMYHPPDVIRHTVPRDNGLDEFIELQNISGAAVPLYHTAYPSNTWRLRDAVDFEFPPNTSIAAGARILVVSFDPADTSKVDGFRARNNVPASVPIYGPFRGKLDNSSEAIELERPDTPEPLGPPNFGVVPYVLVERIRYSDGAPWPLAADGIGASLQRLNASAYGNDPANWVAATRTPGAAFGGGTAPVVTAQPTNKTVVAYTASTLSMAASGANLSYQWRLNGENLPGQTNATLSLTNIQPSQEGFYDVVVLNPAGSTVSSNAFLTVLIPANILSQPGSIVMRGATNETTYGMTFSNGVFAVSAHSSTPLRYQWRFNGANIPGATNAVLTISNATLASEGAYDVEVTDDIASVRSVPATLTVAVPVYVTRHPQPITALVGENIALSLDVRGTEPIRYRWRRGGVSVFNTNSGFNGVRLLTLNNVQATQSGLYDVIVTNVGNATPGFRSSNAVVTIMTDADNDKAGDAWETIYNFSPTLPDGLDDADGDGMKNWEEFRAGTDPTNALSYLKVENISVAGSATVSFQAVSNTTYVVEYRDSVESGPWNFLEGVLAHPTDRVATVIDTNATPRRFYRLVTPLRQE